MHFWLAGTKREMGMLASRTLFRYLVLGALGASLCSCEQTPTTKDDKSPVGTDDDDDDGKGDDSADDGAGSADDDDEPKPRDAGKAPGVDAGKPTGNGKIDASTPADPGTKPGTDGGGGTSPTPSADAGKLPADEPAVACNPADKKPDPKNFPAENINRYKGMKLATPTGPYGFVIETDPAMPESTIYRPMKLGEVKHPVVVWANGGCSKDGTYFSKFLMELASHGFVAVSDGAPNGSGSRSIGTNGVPQTKALDWILAENERPCSQYYHKLDATKTAASGQSCGGLMSLGASGDKRLTTVVIFNSGMFEPDQKIYGGLHAPMAYFIGGMDDIAYPQAETDVKAINTVPLFYGNLDVGHFATWAEDNAGEFGRVGVNWFKWRLMGDPTAEKEFSGADCALCKAPSKWKVQKKMME